MKPTTSTIERIPPQNLEAEQSALGSMMIEPEALHDGLRMLKPSDFYRPVHEEIFRALISLANADSDVDLITTQDELRKHGKLDDCGGTEYLMALVDTVPTAANFRHYADIVKNYSTRRQVIAHANTLIAQAQDTASEDNITDDFMAAAIAVSEGLSQDVRPYQDALNDAWSRIATYDGNPKMGLPFGFEKIDWMTRGCLPGQVVLIGGRPGEGKTVLLAQFAEAAARAGGRVLQISLEMPDDELAERNIYRRARLDATHVQCGKMTEEEVDLAAKATGELYELPIWSWEPTSDPTLQQIISVIRSEIIRHQINAVTIDYLQLINAPGRRNDNRNTELDFVGRQLKNLARTCKIGLVIGTQLNREMLKRKNPKPHLGDLRDGGGQEAHADKVILLHNPQVGKGLVVDSELRQGGWGALAIIAKGRGCRTGEVDLWFSPASTRFDETTDRFEEPATSFARNDRFEPSWGVD